MNKTAVTSILLGIVGLGLVLYGMSSINFDIDRLKGNEEVKEHIEKYDVAEIKNLDFDLAYGEIIMSSSDQVNQIEVKLQTNHYQDFVLSTENNVLKIEDDKNWFSDNWWNMFKDFNRQFEMEIIYPSSLVFENIDIDVSAGLIELNNMEFNNLNTNVSAGEMRLNQIRGNSLVLKNSAGKTSIKNSIIDKIDIDVSAGEVLFDSINFNQLDFDVSAGQFTAKVDNIKEEYTIDIDVSAGNSNVSNQKGTTNKYIKGDISAGNVSFEFK